jgi:methyl-accepting chemotaxis protein
MKRSSSVVLPRLIALGIALLFIGMLVGGGAVHLAGGNATRLLQLPFLGPLLLAFAGLAAICVVLVRRWLEPLPRLRETVARVLDGDLDARSGISSTDEFGLLSADLDKLLARRDSGGSNVEEVENRHEHLYQSLQALLPALTRLSQKDLTARLSTRDESTAPIATALNTMAAETSKTLRDVTETATNVAESVNLIKSQSDQIVMLARSEREQLEECVHELDLALETNKHLARIATTSAEAGEKALMATRIARISAENSASSFQTIRDSLSNTDRRVRLLIERCREIAGAINLIGHLSERTHILALNASMHAAAVGEAGRSFSAVADEVQRLAENAREMTSQLQGVVQQVQTDSGETMSSLQALVSHVHSGGEQASRSHHDIDQSEQATSSLVDSVQKIAAAASTQQQISAAVRQRTITMLDQVSSTGAFLLGQAEHTDNLADHVVKLVETVSTFRLSDDTGVPSEPN